MTIAKFKVSPEQREADIQKGMDKGLSRQDAEDLVNAAEWCYNNQEKLHVMHLKCVLETGIPVNYMAFCYMTWQTVGRADYELKKQVEQN